MDDTKTREYVNRQCNEIIESSAGIVLGMVPDQYKDFAKDCLKLLLEEAMARGMEYGIEQQRKVSADILALMSEVSSKRPEHLGTVTPPPAKNKEVQ